MKFKAPEWFTPLMNSSSLKPRIYTALLAVMIATSTFAQTTDVKKIQYAQTEIEVPEGYTAKDAYSIKGPKFSAQWLYLSEEMVQAGVEKQIIKQFEEQLQYSESTEVKFTSQGNPFSGKKYTLSNESRLKFKILAFGTVDGQPLILNLGFKDDPEVQRPIDEFVRSFIRFHK